MTPPPTIRLALAASLALAAVAAHALDAFPGTKAVTFDGRRLAQAAQGRTPVEAWREFVPQGEPIAHWTRLASIREYPTHTDPMALATGLLRALKQQNPDAPSAIIRSPSTGEVIVDFVTWPPDRAFTEFNLFRYGKRDGGGVVAQQYALRHYGDATEFLRGLKAERTRLVELMAKEGLKGAR
ncbi:MAG: hypothetical protein U1F64_15160 [Burkholderiales bacterium]